MHHARAAKPSNYDVTGGDKPQRGAGTVGNGHLSGMGLEEVQRATAVRTNYCAVFCTVHRWTSSRSASVKGLRTDGSCALFEGLSPPVI